MTTQQPNSKKWQYLDLYCSYMCSLALLSFFLRNKINTCHLFVNKNLIQKYLKQYWGK